MQRDAPPNRATVNHWNTCHRDYGAGLAFFQENSIRIVCSSPPLFAISDVLSIVLGPESAGVERANDFVMDPPLTHSFDSTGTVTDAAQRPAGAGHNPPNETRAAVHRRAWVWEAGS